MSSFSAVNVVATVCVIFIPPLLARMINMIDSMNKEIFKESVDTYQFYEKMMNMEKLNKSMEKDIDYLKESYDKLLMKLEKLNNEFIEINELNELNELNTLNRGESKEKFTVVDN